MYSNQSSVVVMYGKISSIMLTVNMSDYWWNPRTGASKTRPKSPAPPVRATGALPDCGGWQKGHNCPVVLFTPLSPAHYNSIAPEVYLRHTGLPAAGGSALALLP